MKKYFVTEITKLVGKDEEYGVYGYETKREAEAVYYQKLSGARKNDAYELEICVVIDLKGNPILNDRYAKEDYIEE